MKITPAKEVMDKLSEFNFITEGVDSVKVSLLISDPEKSLTRNFLSRNVIDAFRVYQSNYTKDNVYYYGKSFSIKKNGKSKASGKIVRLFSEACSIINATYSMFVTAEIKIENGNNGIVIYNAKIENKAARTVEDKTAVVQRNLISEEFENSTISRVVNPLEEQINALNFEVKIHLLEKISLIAKQILEVNEADFVFFNRKSLVFVAIESIIENSASFKLKTENLNLHFDTVPHCAFNKRGEISINWFYMTKNDFTTSFNELLSSFKPFAEIEREKIQSMPWSS